MEKNRKKVSEIDSDLGCGETLGIDKIKKSDTVLVIGSGTGSDCFLASKKAGGLGKVIGVDMNQSKIGKAKKEALRKNYKNIEFRLGKIEDLPIKDGSIDIVISHCVINLVPDKSKAYKEIYRVLRKRGKMYVSDMVCLRDILEAEKNNLNIKNACMEGALLKSEYVEIVKKAGLDVKFLPRDKNVNKGGYEKLPLERLNMLVQK